MQQTDIEIQVFKAGDLMLINGEPAFLAKPNKKKAVSDLLAKKSDYLSRLAELQERLLWEAEAEKLQQEQEKDLEGAAELSWWQPKQMTEAEYFNMKAESAGYAL